MGVGAARGDARGLRVGAPPPGWVGARGRRGGGGRAAAQGGGRARGARARPPGGGLRVGGRRPRPCPTARDDPARRRPAAAVPVRWGEGAAREGERVGMFHVEHHRNGLIFSALRLTTFASATANVPKLPQQYFAGVRATRLQL